MVYKITLVCILNNVSESSRRRLTFNDYGFLCGIMLMSHNVMCIMCSNVGLWDLSCMSFWILESSLYLSIRSLSHISSNCDLSTTLLKSCFADSHHGLCRRVPVPLVYKTVAPSVPVYVTEVPSSFVSCLETARGLSADGVFTCKYPQTKLLL